MDSGKKFLQAATSFLVAALKQIPGLGVVVDLWDNVVQQAREWNQDAKLNTLESRIQQLEEASAISSSTARQVAQEEIVRLRQQGQDIPPDKADAIGDIVAVMPAHIAKQTRSTLATMKKAGSQYLPLPLGPQSSVADRHSFYVSLIPNRRPRWQPGVEFEDRKGWLFDMLLGMGGFGEVWRIKHKTLGKYQAVKFCLDEKSALILKREEHIIATLPSHTNIVNVIDSNIETQPYWIAFEYVDGGSLESHILSYHGPMPLNNALHLWQCICGGVACAHQIPLVHRDLKPTNILMAKNGLPKIADFGLSKILADQEAAKLSTTAQMSMRGYGTLGWMSPEQREGLPADPSDDVYSLAVLLYQMLTGNPTKEPPRHYRRELERIEPVISKEVIALLSDCLDLPRGERPANAIELNKRIAKLPTFQGQNAPEPLKKKKETPPILNTSALVSSTSLPIPPPPLTSSSTPSPISSTAISTSTTDLQFMIPENWGTSTYKFIQQELAQPRKSYQELADTFNKLAETIPDKPMWLVELIYSILSIGLYPIFKTKETLEWSNLLSQTLREFCHKTAQQDIKLWQENIPRCTLRDPDGWSILLSILWLSALGFPLYCLVVLIYYYRFGSQIQNLSQVLVNLRKKYNLAPDTIVPSPWNINKDSIMRDIIIFPLSLPTCVLTFIFFCWGSNGELFLAKSCSLLAAHCRSMTDEK